MDHTELLAQLRQQGEFFDIACRRRRGGGGTYISDARLMIGDGSFVQFEDGYAIKVPVLQAAQVLAIRPDMYGVLSADQTPLQVPEHVLAPTLREEDLEPVPPGAIVGNPTAISAAIEGGHRVPPGRPEISEAEADRRRAAAAAYLEQLPASELGPSGGILPPPPTLPTTVEASDGQPIDVPVGVVPGETPGWPVDETGRPLRLTTDQREGAANVLIAKTGTEATPDTTNSTGAPATTPPAAGAAPGPVAPVPQGFETTTASDEPRCLAAKADGTQCQNAARPQDGFPQACHMPPHQEQVSASAAAAASLVA